MNKWLVDLEDVDKAVRSIKLGKTAGEDNIVLQHLCYAHPILVKHLRDLFHMIIVHGYVPAKFGDCFIVPLLKVNYGDVGDVHNCTGITLSNVISENV